MLFSIIKRSFLNQKKAMAFRAFYLLFFCNVAFRSYDALRISWSSKLKLFLRLPLYLGLVLFLGSLFLSLNVRKTEWSPPVGMGDMITLSWEAVPHEIISVEPALDKKALRTSDAAILDYEPGITMRTKNGELYSIGAFPPHKVGATYFHVLIFGIGPGIELRKKTRSFQKSMWRCDLLPSAQ